MVFKEEVITRYPEELIIENPGWVRYRHRVLHNSIIAAIWIFWAYLWLPLLSILGWAGQIWFTWYQMVERNGLSEFMELLKTWGWVILALNLLFVVWALFNYFHYRKINRRRARPPVTLEDVATYHQKDLREIHNWWSAKTMVIQHHENGVIASVQPA